MLALNHWSRGCTFAPVRWGLGLLAVLAAIAGFGPAVGPADAAGVKKCKSPKGTRAPVEGLRAGYATSCRTAKKVVAVWESLCEPNQNLCFFDAAGARWGCTWVGLTRPDNPNLSLPNISLRCAQKETPKGRPSVKFTEVGAVHKCATPTGTRSNVQGVVAYYEVGCSQAIGVATAWDKACAPADNGSVCEFDLQGEHWQCIQAGRAGVDFPYRYFCKGDRTVEGRLALAFAVQGGQPFQEGTGL
jgi:hypothetical protein